MYSTGLKISISGPSTRDIKMESVQRPYWGQTRAVAFAVSVKEFVFFCSINGCAVPYIYCMIQYENLEKNNKHLKKLMLSGL